MDVTASSVSTGVADVAGSASPRLCRTRISTSFVSSLGDPNLASPQTEPPAPGFSPRKSQGPLLVYRTPNVASALCRAPAPGLPLRRGPEPGVFSGFGMSLPPLRNNRPGLLASLVFVTVGGGTQPLLAVQICFPSVQGPAWSSQNIRECDLFPRVRDAQRPHQELNSC